MGDVPSLLSEPVEEETYRVRSGASLGALKETARAASGRSMTRRLRPISATEPKKLVRSRYSLARSVKLLLLLLLLLLAR